MSILSNVLQRFRVAPQAPSARYAGGLFRDQAVSMDHMLQMLMAAPETDIVLQNLGLARHQMDRVLTDDEIDGAVSTRLDALKSTPWHLEPGTGDQAEFIEEQLDMHFDAILDGAFQARLYGYSVMEAVYRRADSGRIEIDHIGEKPMQWFRVLRTGELRYVGEHNIRADGEPVDMDLKFFLTRFGATYENPVGEALLTRLYWPWMFRVNGWRFWSRYLERFGDPFLVGHVQSPDEFVKAMSAMGYEAMIGVQRGDEVKSVTTTQQGEFSRYDDAISRRVQKYVLGQTLTTDVGDKGSFAAAKVHDAVRHDKRNSDLRGIVPTVQRIVNALMALNFRGAEPPLFVMEDDTGLQMERAERDAALVNAGIVRLTETYLLRTYDYEEGDIEVPDPADAVDVDPEDPPEDDKAAGGQRKRIAKAAARLAKRLPRARTTGAQRQVDELAAAALKLARSPLEVDGLREAILAASDPQDLIDRLAVVLEGADTRDFEAIVERALFAADVLGYVHASGAGNDPAAA